MSTSEWATSLGGGVGRAAGAAFEDCGWHDEICSLLGFGCVCVVFV